MRLISEKKLRQFWTDNHDSEAPLRAWARSVKSAEWQSLSQVQQTYRHADIVGRCVVFNIGGNKYRLIAAIHYNRQTLYVREILTHAAYSRGGWKTDCGV